jgi:hypothetical protein
MDNALGERQALINHRNGIAQHNFGAFAHLSNDFRKRQCGAHRIAIRACVRADYETLAIFNFA